MIESKIDRFADLLRRRLTSLTKLQLQTSGRITKFPKPIRKRFVMPSSDYEFGSFPGTYITAKAYRGNRTITTDVLPVLNDNTIIEIKQKPYGIYSKDTATITFSSELSDTVEAETQAFFRSYSVEIDGDYTDGVQQLLVNSFLPVIPGDQWYITDTKTNKTTPNTIIHARKTQNANQWDVVLINPVIFYIPTLKANDRLVLRDLPGFYNPNRSVYFKNEKSNGQYLCSFEELILVPISIHPSQIQTIYRDATIIYDRTALNSIILGDKNPIHVKSSASAFWEGVPLNGPSVISIPTATHLKDTQAQILNCVQYAAFDEVIHSVFITERKFKVSSGEIFARAWLNAQQLEGYIDYIPGSVRFIPGSTGWMMAKLHFLDFLVGVEIQSWTANITASSAGRLMFNVGGTVEGFDIVKGTQQLTFNCPNKNISWIEISTNVDLLMSSLTSTNFISHVNLAMHVFNSDHLGSHILGRPSVHGLVKDPSLTWAKTSVSGTNRGFTLTPAKSEDYAILSI